jgi:hypothetical protein
MQKSNLSRGLRIFTLLLAISLFVSFSRVALAAPGNALAGEIVVSGQYSESGEPAVTLNGERVMTGRTFFSAGSVSTSSTASATINLGRLGNVTMSPNSTLSIVLAENSISGELAAGQIRVSSHEGVAVNIKTPDSVITNEGKQVGDVTIDLSSGTTVTSAEAGDAYVNGEPVPAPKMSNKKKALWWLLIGGAVGGIVIWEVAKDDNVVSPVR